MPADLWTAEDVELVEAALQDAPWPCEHGNIQGDRHTCGACLATAVLAALAEAGRLLPADVDRGEHFGVRRHDGEVWSYETNRWAAEYSAAGRIDRSPDGRDGGELVRRETLWWVGPWLPVPAPNLLPAASNDAPDGFGPLVEPAPAVDPALAGKATRTPAEEAPDA